MTDDAASRRHRHPGTGGLLRAAGLTALAAAGFTGLTLLAAQALMPGPTPLPEPGARTPSAVMPADPVLTPRIQELAALPLLDPAQRAEAEAWLEQHGHLGSANAISTAHALRESLRRSALRVAELRRRLVAYDNASPVTAMRAELAELAALAARPDAEVTRWLAKDTRVQSLHALLDSSDRNREPDAALVAATEELASLVGTDEPLVAAWQGLIQRCTALRAELTTLAELDHPKPLPDAADVALARVAAELGAGFGRIPAWRAKLVRVRELEQGLERLTQAALPPVEAPALLAALHTLLGADAPSVARAASRLHELQGPPRPAWAAERDGYGRDSAGTWAVLEYHGVRQRFRYIPAGAVLLGSPDSESGRDADERPVQVTLGTGVWLASTECTIGLWRTIFAVPSGVDGDSELPIRNITWEQAQGFCDELNLRLPGLWARLPSEAEWEKAARAGHAGPWVGATGSIGAYATASIDDCAWHRGTSDGRPHLVGYREPNPYALRDVQGNVWEWCADPYGPYPAEAVRDWLAPDARGPLPRVLRGGSFRSGRLDLRIANRERMRQEARRDDVGFRLAISGQPAADRAPFRADPEPMVLVQASPVPPVPEPVAPQPMPPFGLAGPELRGDGSVIAPTSKRAQPPGQARDRRRWRRQPAPNRDAADDGIRIATVPDEPRIGPAISAQTRPEPDVSSQEPLTDATAAIPLATAAPDAPTRLPPGRSRDQRRRSR